MSAIFSMPKLSEGPQWGPGNQVLNGFNQPYAPFSKADKLGRIADWAQDSIKESRGDSRHQRSARLKNQYQPFMSTSSSHFTYQHHEDETSFSIVDRNNLRIRGTRGTLFRSRGAKGSQFSRGNETQRLNVRDKFNQNQQGFARSSRRPGWKDHDKQQRFRDASVMVKADWQMVEEIEISRLAKLYLQFTEGEDVYKCGFIYSYDKTFDKVSTKNHLPLQIIDRVQFNPTTTEDPIIQQFASENGARIFATDSILSLLMCAGRTLHPWDIVVIREGDKLYFDKRDYHFNPFDYLTVNENAIDAPVEAVEGSKETNNSPQSLSLEATYINQNFGLQVVKEVEKEKIDLGNPNPFYNVEEETEKCAGKGYLYRKFDLALSGENSLPLIVRTEVDGAFTNPNGGIQYMTIRALNEFDSKAVGSGGSVDWRSKLDSQRGSVVATEMKNNSSKLSRWVVQSILAGTEILKLGFVSRVSSKDAQKHVILGVANTKPKEFAAQMNVNISNGWGILRTIVDICLAQPDGKYVLVKDPNKPMLRFYRCPFNSFEEDEDLEHSTE